MLCHASGFTPFIDQSNFVLKWPQKKVSQHSSMDWTLPFWQKFSENTAHGGSDLHQKKETRRLSCRRSVAKKLFLILRAHIIQDNYFPRQRQSCHDLHPDRRVTSDDIFIVVFVNDPYINRQVPCIRKAIDWPRVDDRPRGEGKPCNVLVFHTFVGNSVRASVRQIAACHTLGFY